MGDPVMRRKTALAFLFSFAGLLGCASMGPTDRQTLVLEKAWVRSTPVKEYLGSRRQHRFAPIVYSDLVIAANSLDGIVAYDQKTVSVRWRLRLKDGVEGGAIIDGDNLLFGASDGFFYSVKAASGQINWTYPIKAEGLGEPFVIGGVVYFVAGNNVLLALQIDSGKLNWLYTRRDSSNLSIRGGSRPNVIGDVVYAGFSDGYLVALSRLSGSVIWEVSLNRNKRFRDVDAHPVIADNRIYITSYDGSLYCLNQSDGKPIWSIDDGGESAVVLQDKRLYYSASNGKTMAVDRDSGKILWTYVNPTGIAVQPVLYKKLVLAGEMNGPLRILDERSGEEIGQFDTGWGITARPVVNESTSQIYLMTAGANLYALRLNWERRSRNWPWEN
jgi:outer membrane protein assembly factor BamB